MSTNMPQTEIRIIMESRIAYRLEPNGLLAGPNYHDANLIGLSWKDADHTCLNVRSGDGDEYFIRLSGIIKFGCTAFAGPSIIHDLYIWEEASLPSIVMDPKYSPFQMMFLSAISNIDIDKSLMLLRNMEKKVFFYMTCSYGAITWFYLRWD